MKTLLYISAFIVFLAFHANAQTTETITIDIGSVDVNDSINKPHMLGAIAGPSPNYLSTAPDLTSRYKDVGITTIRNNDYFDDRLDMERMFFCGTYPITNLTPAYPNWSGDPNLASNYHFTESDAQFQNWVNGGFVPFFRLGGENNHPIRSHDYKGPRSSEEMNWIRAGIKVVNHYNIFGGDTNSLQGYLNVWTEYPQKQFWDRDSAEFNNFWCNTYDSLHKNFPSLKIGGPGFNSSISISLGNSPGPVNTHINLFLRELKTRNIKPGWIGFHVFSNDINDFYKAALAYRKLLRAEAPFTSYAGVWGSGNSSFFNGVELICDAWGFDNDQSLPAATRDSLFNKQRGAAHHTGVFIALQQADIERAYIYRGGELGNDTINGAMGLFYGDATAKYKPAAYAFKQCSKMQTTYNKKLSSPVNATASLGAKVWTLAGQDPSGNKAILISNPTSSTINLTLTLNGSALTTATFPNVNLYTITDASNGQTPTAWTSGVFVLPPYTSNLITMSKSANGVTTTLNSSKEIILFPNPAKTIINFSDMLNNIMVFDIYGRQVMPTMTSAREININDLANGIYFIQADGYRSQFVVGR